MDAIQSKDAKAKAKSKSLESQLEKMKQREAAIVARRQELEAKVAKKKRSQRTRAFVCMGALMEKLMKEDDALRQRVLHDAAGENIHNRSGLGRYWTEFMTTEEEIAMSKMQRKKSEKSSADANDGKQENEQTDNC